MWDHILRPTRVQQISARLSWQPAKRLFDIGLRAHPGRRIARINVDAVGGKMRRSERDRDRKRGTAAGFADDRDLTAVKVHQFLNQRETYSRPLEASSPRVFNPMEPFEQLRQFRLRNACSRVAHSEARLRLLLREARRRSRRET